MPSVNLSAAPAADPLRGFTGPMVEGAVEGVGLAEADQERDLRGGEPGPTEVMAGERLAGLPDHLPVTGSLRLQFALQGPGTQREPEVTAAVISGRNSRYKLTRPEVGDPVVEMAGFGSVAPSDPAVEMATFAGSACPDPVVEMGHFDPPR